MRRNNGFFKKQFFYVAIAGVICLAGVIVYKNGQDSNEGASQIKLAQEGNRTKTNEEDSNENNNKVVWNQNEIKNPEVTQKPEEKVISEVTQKPDEIKRPSETKEPKALNEPNDGEDSNASKDGKKIDDKIMSVDKAEAVMAQDDVQKQIAGGLYSFDKAQGIKWPVEGDIILPYSNEEPLYYKTVGSFMVNEGVLIKAKENDKVKCGCDGVVTNVYESDKYGKMIDVSIGDNYTLTYGQLGDIKVNVGDEVKGNQVIATVGAVSDYFAKEGDNVYLQVKGNGKSVDPTLFLK